MTTVVQVEKYQVEALAGLMAEMDRFYGEATAPRDEQVRGITEALFGDPPAAYAVGAWDGDQLVGLATYSFLWPAAGVTRSLFLKELYVAESRRRCGIGGLLMQHIFAIADKHDCSRIEWATDRANREAQTFYDRLGHHPYEGKVFYRATR